MAIIKGSIAKTLVGALIMGIIASGFVALGQAAYVEVIFSRAVKIVVASIAASE